MTVHKLILFFLPILVSVAFITLLERKILGIVGYRLGPNKVSLGGLLQPIGDAVKLSNKQLNFLTNFSFRYYYLRASFIFVSTLFIWISFFSSPPSFPLKFSLLLIFLVLSFNSINSIIRGWRTFRKYSLIGRIRTVSQLISYEASLYLCFFFIVFFYSSFDIFGFKQEVLNWIFFSTPVCLYLWVPSVLAELNRTPYDFSEGERELVRGFNTEFGSSSFTLIFLAEYSNIIFFCVLTSFLFFSPFAVLFFFLLFFFIIWIRSVLPRFRFDKLINLAWTLFIPFLTIYFIFFFSEFF